MKNMTLFCEHKYTVEDQRNGCFVCTDCGLVTSDNLFKFETDNISSFSNINKLETEAEAMLSEICEKKFLTNSVKKDAEQTLHNIENSSKKMTKDPAQTIAFCVYTSCTESENIGRSKKECAEMLGVSSTSINRQIWKHRNIHNTINIVKPSHLFPRYILNTPFVIAKKLQKRILLISDHIYNLGNFRPAAVLAFVIYFFQLHTNRIDGLSTYSMKSIAHMFDVSLSCIKRQIKKWGRLEKTLFFSENINLDLFSLHV